MKLRNRSPRLRYFTPLSVPGRTVPPVRKQQRCTFATASLRQPLLVAGRSFAAKCVIRSAESHSQQERRTSARRGSVRRSPWSENRTAFTDDRLHDQERRASTRRGWANRVCNGNARDFCMQIRIPRTYHGGLTPPALALQCERLPAKQRFLRCTNVHSPKSGGCQPAVGGQMRVGRHEPYSSADRRWCVGVAVAFAFIRATGGLRPPLLCCSANVCRRNNDFCDAPTYIRPRAAGVSPPWLE
jgi:hypothetical protein